MGGGEAPGLRAMSIGLPEGGRLPAHGHGWDQLVHAADGVMAVRTA